MTDARFPAVHVIIRWCVIAWLVVVHRRHDVCTVHLLSVSVACMETVIGDKIVKRKETKRSKQERESNSRTRLFVCFVPA